MQPQVIFKIIRKLVAHNLKCGHLHPPKQKLFFHPVKFSTFHLRCFHTSQSRHVNPVLLAILRPLGKFSAVLVGRGFRKWWNSLPKEKKKLFVDHLIRNKWKYVGILGVSGFAGYDYTQKHITLTPLTDRKRFVLFDTSELSELSKAQFNKILEVNKEYLLAPHHPYVMRVKKVATKLLQSNKSLPQIYSKFWTVSVIDIPEENCFVFPTGQIVIFTGMLKLLDNDDQLAVILAHEISHAILDHTSEMQSYGPLIDFLKIFPIALIWAFMPSDLAAGAAHYLFSLISKLVIELPYSRLLEEEADIVGLFIMAAACFDVREASALWGQLHLMDSAKGNVDSLKPFTWLSTHPSHIQRQSVLDALMEAAIDTRVKHKCSSLKMMDPRLPISLAQKKRDSIDQQDDCCYVDKDKVYSNFCEIVKKFNLMKFV